MAAADAELDLSFLGDAALADRVRLWLKLDPTPAAAATAAAAAGAAPPAGAEGATRAEVLQLVAAKDGDALRAAMAQDIAFGTAGLRGRMAAGFARMNHVTVRAASQGLAAFLASPESGAGAAPKVVVGFDGRHNSRRFAEIAAACFLAKPGVQVFLFRTLAATPMVSYGVRLLGCAAGVMVTASHNPKDDNGYKVYWGNSAQITSPVDKGIATQIAANREPWPLADGAADEAAVLAAAEARGALHYCDEQVEAAYMKEIVERFNWHAEDNKASKTPLVFTPMHGVGERWVKSAFAAFSLPPFVSVPEQCDPDPEFPTVPFPNPEEGKGALALSIARAEASGAPVVIANDPDSDRLAVAEKDPSTDTWRIFSGNEIGILLADWAWKHRKAAIATKVGGKDKPEYKKSIAEHFVINTTVSSKMLKAYAETEGMQYYETLTGFKWLGNKVDELRTDGPGDDRFVFAFEEAIGFMIGDTCLDKDGVRAAAALGEMAVQLYEHRGPKGKAGTFCAHLAQLEKKYGTFVQRSRYFFCYDPAKMTKIFTRIRGEYPSHIGSGADAIKVVRVRDLTATEQYPKGFDSGEPAPDHLPILPVSSSTHMITLWLENGVVITMRGSGTEPKLKYYSELQGAGADDRTALQTTLNSTVDKVLEQCLQPTENELTAPSDD